MNKSAKTLSLALLFCISAAYSMEFCMEFCISAEYDTENKPSTLDFSPIRAIIGPAILRMAKKLQKIIHLFPYAKNRSDDDTVWAVRTPLRISENSPNSSFTYFISDNESSDEDFLSNCPTKGDDSSDESCDAVSLTNEFYHHQYRFYTNKYGRHNAIKEIFYNYFGISNPYNNTPIQLHNNPMTAEDRFQYESELQRTLAGSDSESESSDEDSSDEPSSSGSYFDTSEYSIQKYAKLCLMGATGLIALAVSLRVAGTFIKTSINNISLKTLIMAQAITIAGSLSSKVGRPL